MSKDHACNPERQPIIDEALAKQRPPAPRDPIRRVVQDASHEVMEPDRDWGWPTVTMARHPAPGDVIELPDGTEAEAFCDDGYRVMFGWPFPLEPRPPGYIGNLEHENVGGLRTSLTEDGLFLYWHGSERDGYRCEIVRDGYPGQRRWKVLRGREES